MVSQDYDAAREKALRVGAKKFFLEVRPTLSNSASGLETLKFHPFTGSKTGVCRGTDLSCRSSQLYLRGTPFFFWHVT